MVHRKEQLLEEQRNHLSRKHAQLAEDLAEKQHLLNREWAGLDLAQRGDRKGPEVGVEVEREVMRAEWAAIEGEWEALEERKARMSSVRTPFAFLSSTSTDSIPRQLGMDNSVKIATLCTSRQGSFEFPVPEDE